MTLETLEIQPLTTNATVTRAHDADAGLDLHCIEDFHIDGLGRIIDAGYRGEIKVILHNTSTSRVNFRCGDRIAQLVITPVETPRIRKVVNFTDTTERGGNGFGSTGR